MEDIKCFLLTMGVGFVIGAMVASSNKKVADIAKKTQNFAMDKIEKAKEGFDNVKEKIEEKMEEANTEKDGALTKASNKNKK